MAQTVMNFELAHREMQKKHKAQKKRKKHARITGAPYDLADPSAEKLENNNNKNRI